MGRKESTMNIKCVAVGVVGYLLGRTKKGKTAVRLALWASGHNTSVKDMARAQAVKFLESEDGSKLVAQLRGPVLEGGRQAALSVYERGVGKLTEDLSRRTSQLRHSLDETPAADLGGKAGSVASTLTETLGRWAAPRAGKADGEADARPAKTQQPEEAEEADAEEPEEAEEAQAEQPEEAEAEQSQEAEAEGPRDEEDEAGTDEPEAPAGRADAVEPEGGASQADRRAPKSRQGARAAERRPPPERREAASGSSRRPTGAAPPKSATPKRTDAAPPKPKPQPQSKSK